MGFSNWVHVEVEEIIRETDAAFLCLISDSQVWLPKSQVADAGDYQAGDREVTLSISEWFANKEGLAS